MMNSQELETAVRLKLDLVCVILRDDAYGMIRWKQAHMNLPDYGMALGNPDFVKYAEAYGARGHRPKAAGDLGSMIERAFGAGGVHVIDVPVDYSENDRILNHEIRELASAV